MGFFVWLGCLLLTSGLVGSDAPGIQRANLYVAILRAQFERLAFVQRHIAIIAEDPGTARFNRQ